VEINKALDELAEEEDTKVVDEEEENQTIK
jgi:hypothetical protein